VHKSISVSSACDADLLNLLVLNALGIVGKFGIFSVAPGAIYQGVTSGMLSCLNRAIQEKYSTKEAKKFSIGFCLPLSPNLSHSPKKRDFLLIPS